MPQVMWLVGLDWDGTRQVSRRLLLTAALVMSLIVEGGRFFYFKETAGKVSHS